MDIRIGKLSDIVDKFDFMNFSDISPISICTSIFIYVRVVFLFVRHSMLRYNRALISLCSELYCSRFHTSEDKSRMVQRSTILDTKECILDLSVFSNDRSCFVVMASPA